MCLHEYSIASVICASVGYSAFPVSLKVSQIELLYAFKDTTHLVYCVHGVLLTDYETLYASFYLAIIFVNCWEKQYFGFTYFLRILGKKNPQTIYP